MQWRTSRRSDKAISRIALGVLGALAAMGLFVFYKELPSLRRYVRLKRM
jgi:hypothetical protein